MTAKPLWPVALWTPKMALVALGIRKGRASVVSRDMHTIQTARAACARILCAPALAGRGAGRAAGTRFASSSAGCESRPRLKAFPVFRNPRGVIEYNELFLLQVTGEASAAQDQDADQPSAAAKLAELYADLLTTCECESPILLQSAARHRQNSSSSSHDRYEDLHRALSRLPPDLS
jgi:hypothetical protein